MRDIVVAAFARPRLATRYPRRRASSRSCERVQRLEPRRPAVASEFPADHRVVAHPVQLHCPTRPNKWQMTVERALTAPECQHCAGERHNLARVIIDIICATQQSQSAFAV